MKRSGELDTCPDCGLVTPYSAGERHPYLGASAACWALFGEVLEREYSNPAYMTVHRTTVDAYAAQHPGEAESRTISSINVHLVGLHLTLERRLHPDFVRRVIGSLTLRKDQMRWLSPPASLGEIRIDHVRAASSPEDHAARVDAWGRSVWRAWSAHHGEVVALAERAVQALP